MNVVCDQWTERKVSTFNTIVKSTIFYTNSNTNHVAPDSLFEEFVQH